MVSINSLKIFFYFVQYLMAMSIKTRDKDKIEKLNNSNKDVQITSEVR